MNNLPDIAFNWTGVMAVDMVALTVLAVMNWLVDMQPVLTGLISVAVLVSVILNVILRYRQLKNKEKNGNKTK